MFSFLAALVKLCRDLYGYRQQEEMGQFIVIEGVDGIGKSTLARQLVALFNEIGKRAVLLSFPRKNTPTGRVLDSYLSGQLPRLNAFELHRLFLKNRMEALAEIEHLLDAGTIIVCERFWMSGVAYSIARGLDVNWCTEYEPEEIKLIPDVTVLLDGIDVALETEKEKGEFTRKEYFMRQVSQNFNELFARTKNPGKYIKIELRKHGDIHRDVFHLINKV